MKQTLRDMMSQCWNNRMDCERFDFEKFAEMVAFQASEERLDRCIEALERKGYADAADVIRGEG